MGVADACAVVTEVAERERIAVPVPADRAPAVTTRLAVAVARQAGMGIEFVAAAGTGRRDRCEEQLRARCDTAVAAGASRASWRVLDGRREDIGPYITWSGASLRCVGVPGRHAGSPDAGPCAVPLLLVGPAWQPGDLVVRRVVVGLAGSSEQSGHLAATAAALAARLGAELALIEVIGPGRRVDDDRDVDVTPSAHLHWVAHGLRQPALLFDTVAARRPASGLGRYLAPGTVLVVGAPAHHRRLLGGVAGRLVQRAPCPLLVVPLVAGRVTPWSAP